MKQFKSGIKSAVILFLVVFVIAFVGFTIAGNADVQDNLMFAGITGIGAVCAFLPKDVKSSKSDYSTAQSNATVYHTDVGTGKVISDLEELSGKQVNYADAQSNATAYHTDLATGAVLAALEDLKKSGEKPE